MNRTFARTSAFGLAASAGFMGEGVVRQIANPVAETTRTGLSFADKRDVRLQRTIKRAAQAYMVDGIVRQAVDKYVELCGGFYFDGGDAQVAYITKRLETMSLQTGSHWRTTLSVGLLEFFKVGNMLFSKVRGDAPKARRAFYKNHPYPIAAVFPLTIERLEPAYDERGMPLGFKFCDLGVTDPGLLIEGSEPKPVGEAYLRLPKLDPEKHKGVMRQGLDYVHIAYKRGADSLFGQGVTFQALEDVSLQRAIEQITATVIKKNSHPLVHVRVIRPTSHIGNLQREIDETALRFKRAAPDSVIVTGGTTEMKAIGAESQALRLEGYLDHFTKRAFCSLGVSPYLMGFEGATLGTAQAAQAILLDRVRTAQEEFAQELEMFLLWELLWEGGYDPFNNDADRVYLRFKEKDVDRRIKEEAHWLDTYVKGGCDVDELRTKLAELGSPAFRKPYKYDKLYLNQVQIPLAKVTEDTKVEVARIGAAAKPKTKTEARRVAEKWMPAVASEVESFILLLERVEGIDRDLFLPMQGSLERLIEGGDREAFTELVVQTLTEINP